MANMHMVFLYYHHVLREDAPGVRGRDAHRLVVTIRSREVVGRYKGVQVQLSAAAAAASLTIVGLTAFCV